MKKLTKLVSAIAFASALALIGCANPNNNKNGENEELSLQEIKVSDLQKPSDYTSTSTPISTVEECNKIVSTIIQDIKMMDIDSVFGMIYNSDSFKTAYIPIKMVEDEERKNNMAIEDEAKSAGKPYSYTNHSRRPKGTFYLEGKNANENNGYLKIIDINSVYTYSDNPIEKNRTSSEVSIDKHITKVVDTSLLKNYSKNGPDEVQSVTPIGPTPIKSFVLTHSSVHKETNIRNGEHYETPPYSRATSDNMEGSENEHLIVLYDNGTNNAIIEYTTKIGNRSISVSINLYDVDGKLKHSYTDEEIKALIEANKPTPKPDSKN